MSDIKLNVFIYMRGMQEPISIPNVKELVTEYDKVTGKLSSYRIALHNVSKLTFIQYFDVNEIIAITYRKM